MFTQGRWIKPYETYDGFRLTSEEWEDLVYLYIIDAGVAPMSNISHDTFKITFSFTRDVVQSMHITIEQYNNKENLSVQHIKYLIISETLSSENCLSQ